MTEQLHFHFYALEKEMATHSSVLAWRIPGTGEPGGLPSIGSHRVGHDWSDLAAAAAAETDFLGGFRAKEPACQPRRRKRLRFNPWGRKISWSRKWQPTPVFLPGKSHGQRNLVGTIHRAAKSQTWLKRLGTLVIGQTRDKAESESQF